MKKNEGTVDRILRLVVAAVIVALYLKGVISGVLAIVLGIVALALVVTSFTGFCMLYVPFNISTRKKPAEPKE
jgi:uncharacterized membrane protein